jgi:D-3-phosphoglycerate dehydrogenase
VNAPSVTGELLTRLGPFLMIADRMGCLLAQLVTGQFKEVTVEYAGDFHGLELSPVTTALLKGLLTPSVADGVNSVNAPVLAKEMGIKVTETASADSFDYINLITVNVVTTEKGSSVSGTIFGRNDPRVVNIDDFRLEMAPEGCLALIHNLDKPGAIGSIGSVLGGNKINIASMQVGQAKDGERNIIFLRTDTPIPDDVVTKLNDLPLIKSVTRLEL